MGLSPSSEPQHPLHPSLTLVIKDSQILLSCLPSPYFLPSDFLGVVGAHAFPARGGEKKREVEGRRAQGLQGKWFLPWKDMRAMKRLHTM